LRGWARIFHHSNFLIGTHGFLDKIRYEFAQGYLRASKDEFWSATPSTRQAKRMVAADDAINKTTLWIDWRSNKHQTNNRCARRFHFVCLFVRDIS